MFLVMWISLGVIAGVIYSGIIYRQRPAFIADLILGIFGAVVGGFVYAVAVTHGVPILNAGSALAVFATSMLVLGSFHKLRRMGRGT